MIIKKSGQVYEKNIQPQKERKACSFERIYFSRGNDPEIYKKRQIGKKCYGSSLADEEYEKIMISLRKLGYTDEQFEFVQHD